jgi:hypothetical protein
VTHSIAGAGSLVLTEEDQLRAVGLWTAASAERVLGMAATGLANPALHLRTEFGFDRRPIADPETVAANGLNRHDSDMTSMRADPCAVPAPSFRDLNVLRAPLAERRS